MFEWEWYTDVPTKVLFLHLLMDANYEENTYQGRVIKRGCLITGLNKLAVETGLTVNQIRYALKKLGSTNEIILDTSPQGTHIQIVKYNDYQNNDDDQQADQQADQHADQHADQQLYKKTKKRRKKEALPQAEGESEMFFTEPKNQAAVSELDNRLRWSRLLSVWKTNEKDYVLEAHYTKNWKRMSKENQEGMLQYVESLGPDSRHLSDIWISTLFNMNLFTADQLKKEMIKGNARNPLPTIKWPGAPPIPSMKEKADPNFNYEKWKQEKWIEHLKSINKI
jgi:hypothetical protein